MAVWGGTNKWALYVNGTPETVIASSSAAMPSNASPLYIGQSWNGGDQYLGYMDELGLWSRVLSANDDTEDITPVRHQ